MNRRSFAFLAALAATSSAGCGDDFGPRGWEARVDTVAFFSVARVEHQGLTSGFDFVDFRSVVLESLAATDNWDIALTEQGGQLALLPSGALPGIEPSAGIATIEGREFIELDRAPGDTAAYTERAAVPLRTDRIYVVRSRDHPRNPGCIYFSKVEAVDLDASLGIAELRITRNPFCNDRALVPPATD